ncbi:recombinase family protein [Microbacterium sp. No. 7]|uniref:recombinase family protein n=1 Tax=Microbacterium sp. No. 7 TaxID=1714373 RepID=UPI0006ECF271|nr:recombinase family protein [Microbacterium sp. No. 7]ALJ19474.1 hypothetical protein AOA12_05955 [Microbacterium sp. No. 7]
MMTNAPAKLPRVGIYARQSVPEDQGISQQVEEIREDLGRRGWLGGIVDVYDRDNAVSGSSERLAGTDWARMIGDLRAGRIDTVAVVAPDRLTRNLGDLVLLRDSARVVTARGGIDTADESGTGAFMLAQFVLIAEQEIRTKRARTTPYKHARHARGVPTPGRVPFGYRWIPKSERDEIGDADARYAVVPREAEVVRYVFSEAVKTASAPKGVALGSIARALNDGTAKDESGEPFGEHSRTTREGVPWRISTIRRMLLSPYYAGMLPPISSVAERPKNAAGKPVSWRAQDIDLEACIPGNWDALVSADDVRNVRRSLTRPERRKHDGNTSRKWLLPGIARCGKVTAEHESGHVEMCGAEVDSAWTREGYRAYKCPRGHFSRRAEALDAWAVQTLLERLTRPDAAALLRPAPEVDLAALTAREGALQAQRLNVLRLVARGRFTDAEAEDELAPLDAELMGVRDALAAAYRADPLADIVSADDVRAFWDGLSLAGQRAVLGALFEPIISPVGKGWRVVAEGARGRQLDVADTVRPAWRRVEVRHDGEAFTFASGLTDDARVVLARA